MEKNTAGKWVVFAFQDEGGTNPGDPVTGDAANITANIRIDGGAANAVDDLNPTELEDGYYVFDVTAAETNGDNLLIAPVSSTANVQVIGVPGVVWTTPANFNSAAITATGAIGINWGNIENPTTTVDLSATDINLCDTVTTNTDMRGTDSAFLAASAPTNFSDLAISATTGLVSVGTNNDKTGYSISGTLTTLDALDTAQDSQHSTTQSSIAALNDLDAAGVRSAVGLSAADLDTQLTAIETDTQDIQTRLPAALISGKMDSDTTAINSSTTAATQLARSAETIVKGAATATTLSTTQMSTNLTEATNDHYNGRIVIWTSGVLKDQATNITDYDGTSKTLTYTAITEAPGNGDTFVIV